jgi:aspartyl-tRNA(Asn)/glutamyl-tRNA(Gln) amidotransferase subunit B
MGKYKVTIGMEIHVELGTESKMFCGCKNGMGLTKKPNQNICEVCTAQPGALPVPNVKAIEYVMRAGLALNCQIAKETKFDRKNYFYPDLPKGYQISQYDQPICEKGEISFDYWSQNYSVRDTAQNGNLQETEKKKSQIGITRIHLEEDTGKLMHVNGSTLVDFNRAGVPLMELVTEPDLTSAGEAKQFCAELRRLFRYLKISTADMEKGQMRCEANISLYKEGADRLSGTKVELKNINSFKAIEKGIEYEIKRQTKLLDKNEKVVQETRGWSDEKSKTFSQRTKENSDDYRYFPEPDILPMKFDQEEIDRIKYSLPELPWERKGRFVRQMGLTDQNAEFLVDYKEMADYYEQICSELDEWVQNHSVQTAGEKKEEKEISEKEHIRLYKLAANYLLTETQKNLFEKGLDIEDIKITPENFAELIKIIYRGEINSSVAQTVLGEMFEKGGDPSQIIEEKGLAQTNDEGELEKIAEQVIAENPKSVEDYQKGKENAIKFLMGQVMKATKGKANPKMATEILKSKLS